MFYIDVLVFPIYWMHNFICGNWTEIKRYFILVPWGLKKNWPCKVGRDEKSLKNTGLQNRAVSKIDLRRLPVPLSKVALQVVGNIRRIIL